MEEILSCSLLLFDAAGFRQALMAAPVYTSEQTQLLS
jgi:hypothetical protein